ncbi:glutamine-hydrolyzing carbamoyl-phosphate synthase small subunit [Aquibacillus sp. 3ASR75-11]|uniref:Carbamoyl phosphate synthase small chain n=1 Tax=Terrihalobacillus insolitus TaxID=2950438 RepID=A0A9X4AKU0_9BACI|nr:glutamine-hydrolyzing carbamoyl-phosphate synthase small subunit [Terrihalobacillus insolitus]MDC3412857.1 glutamine-hydrolyzing carbamoyl-phosphate synthase small subunit [Terrihalobacillus insolitus]MDC3423667.1 glutamine-hydrolyzing carbamoyl-phosphate synthase small subunit [Terrihalobacillus insolitus]
MEKRKLVLEDGTTFVGNAFGSRDSSIGEVVFNTGMTGYQEILSDPSYCGQIVTMTYPLIGNYGINRDDFETITPSIYGLIVKELCYDPSNFRSEESLDLFMKAHDIPGIYGIDTRKLTKKIRQHGTLRGILTEVGSDEQDHSAIFEQIPVLRNQIEMVSTANPYVVPGRGYRIVLVDFGMKHGILRELTKRNCHVTVVPHHYSADQIKRLNPDGVMLTNGPGDPKDVPEAIDMVQQLLGEIPVFGICLGHQLLALASGADTEKMKFGHRGSNHPVKDLEVDKTYMTSQNHGYAVKEASLVKTDLVLTQIALNDGTVEGIRHNIHPAFSVQYHPESSPGPEDTNHLFDQFLSMIETFQSINKGETACLSVQI